MKCQALTSYLRVINSLSFNMTFGDYENKLGYPIIITKDRNP